MKTPVLIVLASLFLIPTMGLASGASGTGGLPSSAVDPFQVTEMMKCTVTEIRSDGTIMVQAKRGAPFALKIDRKTEFTAEKAINGSKKLESDDLQVGHKLKVTSRQVNGEVLRVKVLKSS